MTQNFSLRVIEEQHVKNFVKKNRLSGLEVFALYKAVAEMVRYYWSNEMDDEEATKGSMYCDDYLYLELPLLGDYRYRFFITEGSILMCEELHESEGDMENVIMRVDFN